MKKKRDEPLDWDALVPLVIHEIKLAILEAMLWIDEPLAATDVLRMYEGEKKKEYVSSISYHLRSLALDLPVLELYDEEAVRGAWRKLYYFRNRTPASRRRKQSA